LRESWRDRVDRAGLFAGVAADADFGVDQVLADDGRWGGGHGVFLGFIGVPIVSEKKADGPVIPGWPPDHVRGWRRNPAMRTSGFRLKRRNDESVEVPP
jgi:hypothetical protein